VDVERALASVPFSSGGVVLREEYRWATPQRQKERLEPVPKAVTLTPSIINRFHRKIRLNQPPKCVILRERFRTCPLNRERSCAVFLRPALSLSKSRERTLLRFQRFTRIGLPRSTIKYQEGLRGFSMSAAAISPLPLRFPAARKQRMACPEWCLFVEKYAQAARSFSEAAGALPGLSTNGFNHAWEQAEKARKMCDEARSALLRHEHSHDCASPRASW
jgi:hypothetical protein